MGTPPRKTPIRSLGDYRVLMGGDVMQNICYNMEVSHMPSMWSADPPVANLRCQLARQIVLANV